MRLSCPAVSGPLRLTNTDNNRPPGKAQYYCILQKQKTDSTYVTHHGSGRNLSRFQYTYIKVNVLKAAQFGGF